MAVDVAKCADELQMALQWTTAGAGLELGGVVESACKAVIAEIVSGAAATPSPATTPTP